MCACSAHASSMARLECAPRAVVQAASMLPSARPAATRAPRRQRTRCWRPRTAAGLQPAWAPTWTTAPPLLPSSTEHPRALALARRMCMIDEIAVLTRRNRLEQSLFPLDGPLAAACPSFEPVCGPPPPPSPITHPLHALCRPSPDCSHVPSGPEQRPFPSVLESTFTPPLCSCPAGSARRRVLDPWPVPCAPQAGRPCA